MVEVQFTQISVRPKPDWPKRIHRAAQLAEERPWASEVLLFYKEILEFQKGVYDRIAKSQPSPPTRPLRELIDFAAAAEDFSDLLALVRLHGPKAMAGSTDGLESMAGGEVDELLRNSAHNRPLAPTEQLVGMVLLQPHAERLAQHYSLANTDSGRALCPACDGMPLISALRPEGDGGKRWLLCSFCLTEWEFRRILCPYCGEQDNKKLPLFSGGEPGAVSLHACLSCLTYLKTVDLTADGHAVPLVDEVATAELDVWASEQNYRKLQPNLLGF